MIIDMHVHIGGAGHGGTGCSLTEDLQKRVPFRLLRRHLKIKEQVRTTALDQTLKSLLFAALTGTSAVDKAVVLAYDRIYDSAGKVSDRTAMYVPNDYVHRLCSENPKVLFGASVHPDRLDALDELERCVEMGAVLLKWLPSNQCIDPREKRYTKFFQKMADLKLPLLAHTGSEFVLPVNIAALNHPQVLIPALEQGVTVIAAHCGTTSTRLHPDYSRDVIAMMHRYPNCYGDNSALATHRGWRVLEHFRDEGVLNRLVHGSDYPIPAVPMSFAVRGGMPFQEARMLSKITNPFEKDVAVKKALGYPKSVFTNATKVLRLTS